MGIYTAPPHRRAPRHGSRVLNGIARVLTAVSLVTMALVGVGGLGTDWLAIALGEGLLALALVIAAGPGTRSIRAYSRSSGDEGIPDIRVARFRPPDEQPKPPDDEHAPVRRPVRRQRGERPGHTARTPADRRESVKGSLHPPLV
jgi:hypothetical protein